MALHTLTRRLALLIPRVRRYYEHVGNITAERNRLAKENKALRHELAQATTPVAAVAPEAEEQNEPDRTLAATAQANERLELEIYVLRSDLQRAVDVADRARLALAQAQRELEQLKANHSEQLANKDKDGRSQNSGEDALSAANTIGADLGGGSRN
jgi:hypothetical protein